MSRWEECSVKRARRCHLVNLVQKVSTTGSVLSPLIWLTGALYTMTVVLYGVVGDFPAHASLGVAFIMTLYVAFKYEYWQEKDPSRLHSESHLQEMRKIELLGDNVSNGPLIDAEPVANPFGESSDEH